MREACRRRIFLTCRGTLVVLLIVRLSDALVPRHLLLPTQPRFLTLNKSLLGRLQATSPNYFPADREDVYSARFPHSARRRPSRTSQQLSSSDVGTANRKSASLNPDSFFSDNNKWKSSFGQWEHRSRRDYSSHETRGDSDSFGNRGDWNIGARPSPVPATSHLDWDDYPRSRPATGEFRPSRFRPVSRDSTPAQLRPSSSSLWHDEPGRLGSSSSNWSSGSRAVARSPSQRVSPSRDEENNYWYVNYERLTRGLPEVLWSVDLHREARRWARYLASTVGELKHRDPLSQNLDPGWKCVTENVAYNMSPDYDGAHTSLMKSPGHRRNILDPSVNRIGVGVAKVYYPGSDVYRAGDLYYVVHIFKQV